MLPLVEQLRAECDERAVPISVDTRKPAVMRAAIAAGASMINDVGALQAQGALQVVARQHGAGSHLPDAHARRAGDDAASRHLR